MDFSITIEYDEGQQQREADMADYRGWVYLEDEMPRIGSGLRLVEGQVGRKWVRMRSATSPTTTDRSRIHISIWRKILRRTEKRGVPWK